MTRVLLVILTVTQTLQPAGVPQAATGSGERVAVGTGKQVSLDSGRLIIGLDAVISDSRCPAGYQCISAGEARVRIWVEEGSGARQWRIISGPGPVRYEVSARHSLQMVSLEPKPEAGVRRQPQEYVATFIVTTNNC